MKALPWSGSGCSARLAGVAAVLPGLADNAQNLPYQTDREMENSLKWTFSSFPPSRTGGHSARPPKAIQSPGVQTRCIFLPKFANREMSDHLRSPTAGLGCGVVCTTFGFAQKRDTQPVGGRGISAFSDDFSLLVDISSDALPFPGRQMLRSPNVSMLFILLGGDSCGFVWIRVVWIACLGQNAINT